MPENLGSPLLAARSLAQILGILGVGFVQSSGELSKQIFPVAFYVSYFDVVGAVGYGYPVTESLHVGMNLKVVNRRFTIDRIPVTDYDAILSNVFSDLESSTTGVTADLGGLYTAPFGTEFGLSLQNIIPLQTLDDQISTQFINHSVMYDRDQNDQIIVNAQGDTSMIRVKRPVDLITPFELSLPLIANIGVSHPISEYWQVGLDWADLFENDARYSSTWARLRIGTEYRYPLWPGKLELAGRIGFGDERLSGGLGFIIYDHVYLDGAYAYERLIQEYAYFAQFRVVL